MRYIMSTTTWDEIDEMTKNIGSFNNRPPRDESVFKRHSLSYYEFECRGKVYKLRLTVSGAIKLEEKYNTTINEMFEEDIISVRLIADLFLQMIVTFEPNMTVSDVYNIIDEFISDEYDYSDLVGVISDALEESGF